MSRKNSSRQKRLGTTPANVPLTRLPHRQLTQAQFERAKAIARERSQSYKSIEGGRLCGQQSNIEAHLTGLVGEIAFAVETGSRVDDTVYQRGDDGYDFRVGALTIDVKTTSTHIDRPDLIVPVDPTPTADLFFLLHRVSKCIVRFVGCTDRSVVTGREPVREPGTKRNYVVPQEELRCPPEFEATLVEDYYHFVGPE